MKIEHKQIKVGSRIKIKEDIEMFNCTYTKGHEFKVVSESERGFNLEDDDGNKMDECLFIHDKLELIDVENKSHIKFCVAYTLRSDRDDDDKDSFRNFEEREGALKFYEELLTNPLLYTANFCEVIETTG